MTDTAQTVETEHFLAWTSYWGQMHAHTDLVDGLPCLSRIYGFENVSPENEGRDEFTVNAGGAVYGYLAEGDAYVRDRTVVYRLRGGQWFTLPDGCTGQLFADRPSRLVICQRMDYFGIRSQGGPIESVGRLKYIDTCSDSLLVAPPIKGDPCLNHLHFPPGIDQTEHTHPSIRAGIVARGQGWCETPISDDDFVTARRPNGKGAYPLTPGTLFSIPVDGRHNFLTDEAHTMDVIAYHPDSDWGPTHEEHPMVNRTWVDGEKIDNTTGVHQSAEVVAGDRRVERWGTPAEFRQALETGAYPWLEEHPSLARMLHEHDDPTFP